MFPRIRTVQSEFDKLGEVVGLVTATTYGRETWVGDRWIGYLMADGRLVRGRWHAGGDLWGFAPENSDAVREFHPDSEWIILDGYWGGRAELVLDLGRQWQKKRFEPSRAIRFKRRNSVYMKKGDDSEPAEGELVKNGWDHAHCEICYQTLGSGGQPDGYVSESETWVCERCYDTFVHRRSLEFIPSM